MALILNIETSSIICSVCLSKEGEVIAHREDRSKNSHARVLTLLIDDLVKGAGYTYNDLNAIAVSAGPGSYTGLRIGVSAAKGFCYALGKPLIAVPTLLSLWQGIKQKTETANYIMPAIDARRQDVYTEVFDTIGNTILPGGMLTLDEALEEKLNALGNITIGGDAAGKCRDFFKSPNISFVDGVECDSRLLAEIAEKKYQNNDFADVAYFEPMYLNEFVAKLPKKQQLPTDER